MSPWRCVDGSTRRQGNPLSTIYQFSLWRTSGKQLKVTSILHSQWHWTGYLSSRFCSYVWVVNHCGKMYIHVYALSREKNASYEMRYSEGWPYAVKPSIDQILHQFVTLLFNLTLLPNLNFLNMGLACVLILKPISPELVLFTDFLVLIIPRYNHFPSRWAEYSIQKWMSLFIFDIIFLLPKMCASGFYEFFACCGF